MPAHVEVAMVNTTRRHWSRPVGNAVANGSPMRASTRLTPRRKAT